LSDDASLFEVLFMPINFVTLSTATFRKRDYFYAWCADCAGYSRSARSTRVIDVCFSHRLAGA